MLNDLYTNQFVNQALLSGLPKPQISAILKRAEEITRRNVKTAAPKLDIVDSLLAGARMQKTASSVSYVHGILNEALVKGANVAEAIKFTKKALDATNARVAFIEKVSAIERSPELSGYAEGFIGRAKEAGMSHEDAVSLVVDVIDHEKRAHGDPSGGDMFKGAPGGGPDGGAGAPPGGDPSAGGPPGGDPSGGQGAPGGSDPEEAQILQMLQSLPPAEQQQIIQQLLAAISGGQQGGGPAGPGAGSQVAPGPMAPPPGMPPGGAGGPPPGAGGPPGM